MSQILNAHEDAIVVVAIDKQEQETTTNLTGQKSIDQKGQEQLLRFPLCNSKSLRLFGIDLTKPCKPGINNMLDIPRFTPTTAQEKKEASRRLD